MKELLNNTLLLNEIEIKIDAIKLDFVDRAKETIKSFLAWLTNTFKRMMTKIRNTYSQILVKINKVRGKILCGYNLKNALELSVKSSKFVKECNSLIDVLKDTEDDYLIEKNEKQLNNIADLNDSNITSFLSKKGNNFIKIEDMKSFNSSLENLQLTMENSEKIAKSHLEKYKKASSVLEIKKASLWQYVIRVSSKNIELLTKVLIESAMSLARENSDNK